MDILPEILARRSCRTFKNKAVVKSKLERILRAGQLSYPIDIAFAASSMILQATKEQLGSCVVTTFDEQEIKDLLNIPYGMKVVLLILLGYALEESEPTTRKTLKRIVSYDHW